MGTRPAISEIVALQQRLNMADTHIVWLDDSGFTLAHTDEERATIDLEDCGLHLWLMEHGKPSECQENDRFWAVREREIDGYSTTFRSDAGPYVFKALDVDIWDYEE
jgi:hypothetical protein